MTNRISRLKTALFANTREISLERALIDEKNLEAGMKLPAERQLAMQLGVSRNSLRERRWQGYCESIIRAYKFTSS